MDRRRCPCGSPLPTLRVQGRTEEILRLPGPTRRAVALLPMALATVVEETPGVHRFQVVQTAPTALAVRLEARSGSAPTPSGPRSATTSAATCGTRGCRTSLLELAPDPPRVSPRGGKLRHVVNELPTLAGWPADQHH